VLPDQSRGSYGGSWFCCALRSAGANAVDSSVVLRNLRRETGVGERDVTVQSMTETYTARDDISHENIIKSPKGVPETVN